MNTIVKAAGLTQTFHKLTALDAINAAVPAHSITGLVGKNGSGKTTLLKIIAGKLRQTSGEIHVFGENPMDNIKVLGSLLYSYHNISYDKNLQLHQILRCYQDAYTLFDREFAVKLLRYFDLDKGKRYNQLSQGMAAAFNYICALSSRAPLTILDEPVLGMDVTVRKAVYDILLRDFTEYPRTWIISSHLLSEMEGILSDLLLLEKGKIVLHGSMDDLRQSAYRVDGPREILESFCENKTVIFTQKDGLSGMKIIHEPLCDEVICVGKALGLLISSVRAEDLCVYMTTENKEEELQCLWQKKS